MAKVATRSKPAPQAAPQAARASSSGSGPSKAQRAAQAQGRAPQSSPPRRDPPPAEPKRQVAARQQASTGLAEYGDPSQVPAFMRQDMGMGKENIGREDVETPRLKLIQGLSPELQEYNELRAGNFFHSSSETIFDAPFRAVPIFMDRQFILWRPRDAGGGIMARAADGVHWSPEQGDFTVQLDKKDGGHTVLWKLAPTVQRSGLAEWGTMNPNDPKSPPAATLMYNFVLAFPDHPDLMPAVLTFQRSSIKQGRRLNGKLKAVRTPLFGLVFEFNSFVDNNNSGQDFYNVNARGAGLLEDEDQYKQYREMHLAFKDVGLQIKDIETVGDEDVINNTGGDTNGDGRGPNY